MNLSISSMCRITGIVLVVIGLSMLPSIFVSVIYDGSDVYMPFIYTMIITLVLGLSLTKFFIHDSFKLKVRDGFLIVTLCWIISCFTN